MSETLRTADSNEEDASRGKGEPGPASRLLIKHRRSSGSNVQPKASLSHRRTTLIRRNKPQIENTYRTEPTDTFPVDDALKIIQAVFEKHLPEVKYDSRACAELAKDLADEIRRKVKELRVDRYKYVAVVAIGQRQDTAITMGSRCLLNTDYDKFATYYFESYQICATGIVFAFYYE